MKITRSIIMGAIAGLVTIIIGIIAMFVFDDMNLFYFLLSIGILIAVSPFVISTILETKSQREKDEMFLEFSISLVESVESGTPISKSIINLSAKGFGSLSPHLEKLANQIELGIPLQKALATFAEDTKSTTIIRAITLIREADRIGGDITTILDSVARSVSSIEKLKAERRSAISSIVVEGYIIFFIFIVIVVVIEFAILPMTEGLTDISGGGGIPSFGAQTNQQAESETSSLDFSLAFLLLLIVQGAFAGLIIGKLAEGDIKSGIKHSFIMIALALIISTGSRLIF